MNEKLKVLDLFSGLGIFSLGLKRAGGFRTVAYCDNEPYCQEVLQARMLDGSLDTAPICTNIEGLDGKPWRGGADVLCGGFPCQDISSAGLKEGIEGSRSGLWKEFARLIDEIRPRHVIVENVSALRVRGMGRVLGDLAGMGYRFSARCLCSCLFGTPHHRERVWIVANPAGIGRPEVVLRDIPRKCDVQTPEWASIDAGPLGGNCSWTDWETQSGVQLVGHGYTKGVVKHHAIGNSGIPQIVEWIGRRIMAIA